jgi:superfamily II DNA or RNA helicase
MGVYKAMMLSKERNAIIVQFVLDAYKAGRTVVVMGDIIDHLKKLQLLVGAAGVPGEDTGFYIGELAKNKDLLKFNAHKRVVFCTYGMTSEGTDYPHWDTLVMITPRSNAKQAVGRILRKKDGKKTPVILDLIDHHSIFKSFFYKRLEQYHSVHAEVKWVKA